jgi:large subunit ribosomal protein L35
MPKLKNHRGASKRFKVSATGRIRHKRAGKSHLLTHKSRKLKRQLKKTVTVSRTTETALRRLLSYQM